MKPVASLDDIFSSEDRDRLQTFLSSRSGASFMLALQFLKPSFSNATSCEAVALQAQRVAGYEDAINEISRLVQPPEEVDQTPTEYPPLDDDSKWPEELQPKTL